MDVIVLPAALERITLQHFPRHVRAASRGVHFLSCDHVAGTHRAAFVASAFADADTALRRTHEVPCVFGKFEISFRLPRTVVGTEPEMLIRLRSVDKFSG